MLTKPDFRLDTPNPYSHTTDAEWWLWLRLKELEPKSKLGGIYANKSGFHNTGNANEKYWPGNYSIRIDRNRRGPWWREYASALDWTFPDAQAGDYKTINKYTQRLMKSALDPNDPRLDMILYEFYGQSDTDKQVEGYNEYYEEHVTSDQSHLWHIHFSFFRDACGDFWAMWALLTVLMGWTVKQWQDSLKEEDDTMYCEYGQTGFPVFELQWALKEIGYDPGPLDGIYGDKTAAALVASGLVGGRKDGKVYGAYEHYNLQKKLQEHRFRKVMEEVLAKLPTGGGPTVGSKLIVRVEGVE